MRIVSLLPSATEIVCALGAGGKLVGRSSECDFPEEVRGLPAVMRPRTLDSARPSAEIDRRVRDARQSGESLYELDLELLRRLRPDVLITQDLCGVCSVTEDEVATACTAAGIRPNVVSLSPRTLEEVWSSVETVGAAIGRASEARRLASRLRERASSERAASAPRVVVAEWLDPPILAGLWTPAMVAAAGGTPLGPAPGEVGHRSTWEEIARLRADLLVLSPCSFSCERTRQELDDPRLAGAVSRVGARLGTFVADEAYFSRPGPRLADGIDLLRSLVRGHAPRGPMPVARWNPRLRSVTA